MKRNPFTIEKIFASANRPRNPEISMPALDSRGKTESENLV